MTRMALDERRSLLVDAALTVVKRDGVAGATTRAIVKEAGMPLGAFHYAFSSRDELLGAVVEAVTELDRMAAERALGGAQASGNAQEPADGHTPADADAVADATTALRDLILRGIDLFLDQMAADPYAELAFLELMLHGARQDLDDGRNRNRYSVAYSTPEYLLARSARQCNLEWTVPLRHAARLLVGALDGITLAYLADHDLAAARASAAFHADALSRLSRAVSSGTASPRTASPRTASPRTASQEN